MRNRLFDFGLNAPLDDRVEGLSVAKVRPVVFGGPSCLQSENVPGRRCGKAGVSALGRKQTYTLIPGMGWKADTWPDPLKVTCVKRKVND